MSNCQGKKFKVWVRLPRVTPPIVRYHFGNGNWTEQIGDTYSIISPTLLSGAWPDDESAGISNLQYFTNFDPNALAHYKGGNCRPAYPHLQYPLDNNSVFAIYTLNTAINACNNGQYYSGQRIHFWLSGSKNALSYGSLPLSSEGYITSSDWVEGIKYRLKIYHDNQLVKQEHGDTLPTVEFLPPSVYFPTDELLIAYSGENNANQTVTYQENQDFSVSILQNGVEIHRIQTTSGSDTHPQVEIRCSRNCEYSYCKIICSEIVCCYDSQGNLIDSFPLKDYFG